MVFMVWRILAVFLDGRLLSLSGAGGWRRGAGGRRGGGQWPA